VWRPEFQQVESEYMKSKTPDAFPEDSIRRVEVQPVTTN
jgi:hypothetical protein